MVIRERHEMYSDDGDDATPKSWICPECGYRLRFEDGKDDANFRVVVVDKGDTHSLHFGSTAGLSMSRAKLEPTIGRPWGASSSRRH